jgi:hypothetical protein
MLLLLGGMLGLGSCHAAQTLCRQDICRRSPARNTARQVSPAAFEPKPMMWLKLAAAAPDRPRDCTHEQASRRAGRLTVARIWRPVSGLLHAACRCAQRRGSGHWHGHHHWCLLHHHQLSASRPGHAAAQRRAQAQRHSHGCRHSMTWQRPAHRQGAAGPHERQPMLLLPAATAADATVMRLQCCPSCQVCPRHAWHPWHWPWERQRQRVPHWLRQRPPQG